MAVRYGVGDSGPLRLVTGLNGPLLGVTSLLALAGLASMARGWRRRVRGPEVLWVAWGITGFVLFTFSNRAPAHYTEAYAPALAVLAAVGLSALAGGRQAAGVVLRMAVVVLIAGYALWAVRDYPAISPATTVAAGVATLGAVLAVAGAFARRPVPFLRYSRYSSVLAALGLLAIPVIASAWISVRAPREGIITLPNPLYYAHEDANAPEASGPPAQEAMAHVQRNSGTVYALATDGFNRTGSLVAYYGLPVLTFWSEYQRVPLFGPAELETLVGDGEVRYFLVGVTRQYLLMDTVGPWLSESCLDVSTSAGVRRPDRLWDCAPRVPKRVGGP